MSISMSQSNVPESLTPAHLSGLPVAMMVSDPSLEGHPLIYVNDAFETVSGFPANEAVGRGYDFMQGERTDPVAVERIRAALKAEEELSLDLVNYRKDGSMFWNRLLITPVQADRVEGLYFLGLMTVLPRQPEAETRAAELDERLLELQHRIKNHMALIVAMIRREARRLQPEQAASLLAKRVETIGLLYTQVSFGADSNDAVNLADYAVKVGAAMQALSDTVAVKLEMEVEEVRIGLEDAARIGLILSEVLTNALRHAFADRNGRAPEVRVTLARRASRLILRVVDNGGGLKGANWPNSDSHGGRIVLDLVGRLGGELDVASSEEGVTVTLFLPDPAHAALGGAASAR
ncbi:MAG: PAS domain-containing protein [Oceanicaulis sp.]